MSKASDDEKIVMSTLGIGFVWSLTITTKLGEVEKSPDPKKLILYTGIIPSTKQSESKERHESITEEENKYLRRAIVECAWLHKRHAEDTYPVRFFDKMASKKDGKITALVTGQKLLTVIYWMLKGGKFRP